MKRTGLLFGLIAALSLARPALAEDAARPVKIGVLSDFNSIFADLAGKSEHGGWGGLLDDSV